MPHKSKMMSGILMVGLMCFAFACSQRKEGVAGSPHSRSKPTSVRFCLASRTPTEGYQEAKDVNGDVFYLAGGNIVTESDIVSARSESMPGGQVAIGVTFSEEGGQRMHDATATHIDELIACVVDGQIVMTATIKDPVSTKAMITGLFTPERAEEIARSLNQ